MPEEHHALAGLLWSDRVGFYGVVKELERAVDID